MSIVTVRPSILAVTPDDRLYSSLLYIATQDGWITRWVRSASQALEIPWAGTNSILLYDWYAESHPWQEATDRFLEADPFCCIVLAAAEVDEELWEQALQHGVYDVAPRTGPASALAITLQFAWKNRQKIMPRRDSGCLNPELIYRRHGRETADPRDGFAGGHRFGEGPDSTRNPGQRDYRQA